MRGPTTRTLWRFTGKVSEMEAVTEEAVPWCAEHDSEWDPGERVCIAWLVQFVLRHRLCRLEDPPKHWKETG